MEKQSKRWLKKLRLRQLRVFLLWVLTILLLVSPYSVASTPQTTHWTMAIAPQFDEAHSFSEGLARVGQGQPRDPGYGYSNIDQYGYIDKTGTVVIPFQFKQSGDFSQGLAWMGIDSNGDDTVDKYGYIDPTGKTVIEARFEEAGDFSEGLAPVKIDAKWGYINQQGKAVIPPQFDYADQFGQGLAVVGQEIQDSNNPNQVQYGYINQQGKLVIPFQFSIAKRFSEGLAVAESLSGNSKGYINQQGKFVIKNPQFDAYGLGNFSSGLAVVELNGGSCSAANYCDYGYINKTGKLVIQSDKDVDFTGALSFSEGLAAVATGGGGRDAGGWYPATNWGYLDSNGKFVILPEFEDAGQFSSGLAPVSLQGQYGYIAWSQKQKLNRFISGASATLSSVLTLLQILGIL